MATAHLIMIAAGFLLGGCLGWILHRADYCTAAMFRDLFLFRATLMLKTFVLFLALAAVLFELIRLSGLAQFPFPKYGPPSGVSLLGGFIFGIGMVLAGGCAVGTLYKMGAGRFPSLLAFIGMISGSLLFAVVYPVCSVLSKGLQLPVTAITLPDLLRLPPWLVIPLLLLVAVPLLWNWFRQGRMHRTVVVEGYLQPWQAAVALALLSALFLALMGLPMGITTTNAKLGALLLQLLAPDFYASVTFFQLQSFRYLPPLGGGVVSGGAGAALDGVALVQYPLIAGIIVGSAWSAWRLGEWRLRVVLPWRQVCSALVGGILMGFASRMAPSCNLWHLNGGLPILGLQSILFLAGLVPGAWLGVRLLTGLVMPAQSSGGG